MKIIDKFNLVLFSIIILIISLLICILAFGWIDLNLLISGISFLATNTIAGKIVLGVAIVLILLSIKSIFFNSFSKDKIESKDGILLENDNGKLLVSRDTIESLTNAVVKSFESAENVMTKVEVDSESHVKIYITLFVYPDAVVKESYNNGKISARIYAYDSAGGLIGSLSAPNNNVKDTIKKSLDLDVTEVNIRIKNVSIKKEPNIKE